MEVKGVALTSLPTFIQQRFSEAGFHQWLEALSEEQRKELAEPVLEQNWYPLREYFIEPTQVMCDLFYHGDLLGAWENGRFSADYGLSKIFKVFIKIGTPSFILKRASTLLQLYYRPCSLKLIESGRSFARLQITRFEESHTVIDHRIGGWMERALELHGCIDPDVTITRSLSRGDQFTEYNMVWK